MNKFAISMAVLSLSSVGAFANLLSNGGFESNDYGGTDYKVYNAGDTGIANWGVAGVSSDIVGTDYSPHTGSYALDLVGTPGAGWVYQSVNQTIAARYKVTFWARYTGDDINKLVNVYTDDPSFTTFTVTNTWAEYSYEYTAALSTAQFGMYSHPGNTTNGNTLIDDVSIEAVPEPATMAVLGLGLLAIARRRRSK